MGRLKIISLIAITVFLWTSQTFATVIVEDTFTRNTAGDWESADTGGAWDEGVTELYDTTGTTGTLTPTAGSQSNEALIYGTTYTDFELLVQYTNPGATTSRGRITVRDSGSHTTTGYEVRMDNGGTDAVKVYEVTTDSYILLGSFNLAFQGVAAWARIRMEGSALKVRGWLDSGSEPGTWDLEPTDATHASGTSFGLGSTDSAGGRVHIFDNLSVDDLAGGAATTVPVVIMVD